MKIRSKQQGFALIVLLALLTTAAAAITVKAINNGNNQITRDQITAAALAQAKEALIGYAITYAENHSTSPQVNGYLPCPDTSGTAFGSEGIGEGAAEGTCGAQDVSVIGRLPWKTLKLPPLRGGDGECLWYAISGAYKYSPKTGIMNWDTNGQLQVYASDGALLTTADNQAVAVIFAPGTTTTGQNRAGTTAPVCGGNYTASNYLDTVGTRNNATVSAAANALSQFQSGALTSPSSDRMAFITKQDIWNAMKRRQDFLTTLDTMTRKTAECIAKFGTTNNTATNKSLPWPAQLALSDYTNNTRFNDSDSLLVGRVPYKVNTAKAQTVNTIPSPYYLLQDDNPSASPPAPAYCAAGWTNIYPWWDNWKEHLFYAISDLYKPASSSTTACSSGHCVSVNGSGNYAAVVIFAGEKLAGQIRTDKSVVSAYLEGRNATNINAIHPFGNENYQADTTSTTFNDIVYCIKTDLTVVKGTAAGCP